MGFLSVLRFLIELDMASRYRTAVSL